MIATRVKLFGRLLLTSILCRVGFHPIRSHLVSFHIILSRPIRFPPPEVPSSFVPRHVFPPPAPPPASSTATSAVLQSTQVATLPPPPPDAPPPSDPSLRAAIDGMAAFVARCGPSFEALAVKRAQRALEEAEGSGAAAAAGNSAAAGASATAAAAGGPQGFSGAAFSFLLGGIGSDYYKRRVWEMKQRQGEREGGRGGQDGGIGSEGTAAGAVPSGDQKGKSRMALDPDGRGRLLGEVPLPSTAPSAATAASAASTGSAAERKAGQQPPPAAAAGAAAGVPLPHRRAPAAHPPHSAAAQLAAMMASRFESKGTEEVKVTAGISSGSRDRGRESDGKSERDGEQGGGMFTHGGFFLPGEGMLPAGRAAALVPSAAPSGRLSGGDGGSGGGAGRVSMAAVSVPAAAAAAATAAAAAVVSAGQQVAARFSEERWRPLPLLCRRFNVADPYAGKVRVRRGEVQMARSGVWTLEACGVRCLCANDNTCQ